MQCLRCATPLPEGSRFCNSCGADVAGDPGELTRDVDLDRHLREKLQEEVGRDFVVGRELGRGGMAIVYEARDAHLGRKVAIKILPPEMTFGRGLVERFKREARTAATLDHPHIIPIHRVSTGGRLFWYVMKYLDGEPLAEKVLREGAQPCDVTVDVIEQVADALQYAHDHGVIHRDVKPANVMLDARGWVTVTDFGIAKASSEQSMTGSGSMIGTPDYMSPEQCSGKKVTGAADQYSLGIVAYQMLSGLLPFCGESAFEVIRQHCLEPPPPLAEVNPAVPPAMVAVVERAIAKAPEDRFPSVVNFAAALREAWEAWEAGRAGRDAPAEGPGLSGSRSTRRTIASATPRPPRTPLSADIPVQPPAPTEIMEPAEVPRQGTTEPRVAAPAAESPAAEAPAARQEGAAVRPAAPAGRQETPSRTPRPAPPFVLPPAEPEERSLAVPLAIVAAIVLVGGVFGTWKMVSARRAAATPEPAATAPAVRPPADTAKAPAAQVPRAVPAASPAAPAAPHPRGGTVSFVVQNLPPRAELRFDGLPVPGTSWRARAGTLHVLVLTAPGYQTWSGGYTLRAGETKTIDFRNLLRPAR